jgi:hypothetical protein
MINEVRKWIDLINEIENNEIKYFGKVSNEDQKWLEQKEKVILAVNCNQYS